MLISTEDLFVVGGSGKRGEFAATEADEGEVE